MGRRPGTTCSRCHRSTTLAATRSDGAGGRRCKVECAAPPAPAEEVREPLASAPSDDRGTCATCGEALTPENSAQSLDGRIVHIGCVPLDVPIERASPCAGCDAERGEACAWATLEPASYVHPQRVRLLAPEERASIATRATEDRIRALCDHWASLPGPHLMPMRGAIVRAITSDGATDALLAVETLAAMIERGEIVEHTAGDVSYYRRAPGSAPVVMGRVGVRAVPVPSAPATIEEALMFAVLEDVVAHGAVVDDEAPAEVAPGMREDDVEALADPLAGLPGEERARIVATAEKAQAGRVNPWQFPRGGHPPTCPYRRDALNVCTCSEVYHATVAREAAAYHARKPPEVARVDTAHGPIEVEIAAPAPPLSPAEAVLVELQEIAQALSRARGAAGSLLGLAVRARAAEELLDGVQRERDDARAQLAAAPTPEELALAKDLARLAQLEAADRLEEARSLRGGLAGIYRQHGGTDLAEDADLAIETAAQVEYVLQIAARDAEEQRRRAETHASRVITLRAGIVAALAEPPAEPADVGDAELVALLRGREAPDTAERPTLSKSEVGVLRRCPRRYFYEYEQGRTPASGSGVEAEWGSALHRGLEAFGHAMKAGAIFVDVQEAALSAALAAAMGPGEHGEPAPTGYAAASLRAVLRAYVAAWGPLDAEQYEVVGVEVPFDLPVVAAGGEEAKGRREGRMDAIVRRRDDGRVWIVEHKSTGKPPSEDRFYHGLDIELQPSLYYDAARILGYEPAGVLYDVVRRPEFDRPKAAPQRNKDGSERKSPTRACEACGEAPSIDCPACAGTGRVSHDPQYSNPRHGESPSAYEERLYTIIVSDPAEWFGRRELPIAEWQVEETREDFRAAAEEVAWRRQTGHWPRVGDRYVCAAVKMTCPWIDVCGRRESAEDDRLFPLKVKRTEEERKEDMRTSMNDNQNTEAAQ